MQLDTSTLKINATLEKEKVLKVKIPQVTIPQVTCLQASIVPDRKTGSCLNLELPGNSLQKVGGEGPSPPYSGKKSQF
jgi:hypothetical protein